MTSDDRRATDRQPRRTSADRVSGAEEPDPQELLNRLNLERLARSSARTASRKSAALIARMLDASTRDAAQPCPSAKR